MKIPKLYFTVKNKQFFDQITYFLKNKEFQDKIW